MAKKSHRLARPRVAVPLTQIEEEFRAQLKFLNASCLAYDSGDRDEFRRIALAIRILVHDHGQSKSLANQLGIKALPFKAFSAPVNPANLLSETPLVMMHLGPGMATYLPRLDQGLALPRTLSFEDWWNEEVFRSPNGVSMARSGFILHTANQAGGAHVDPELDEDFHKIAKENEAGWIVRLDTPEKSSSENPMEDLEKAYVRHIGFEVLQVLQPVWERIRGNRFCDCGSGRKYRYCHGR